MSELLVYLSGVVVIAGVYLLLSHNLLRIIYGIILLTSAINLFIFAVGGVASNTPAILERGRHAMANPLPQALILTAIVIGFALLAYCLVLVRAVWLKNNCVDTESISGDEPIHDHWPDIK